MLSPSLLDLRFASMLRVYGGGIWVDGFLLTIYYFGVDSIGDERCWVVFARGRVSFELEFVGARSPVPQYELTACGN